MPNYQLVEESTGKPVTLPRLFKDFRDDIHLVTGFAPPRTAASTGRIYTDKGEFYPSVCDLKIVDLDETTAQVEDEPNQCSDAEWEPPQPDHIRFAEKD